MKDKDLFLGIDTSNYTTSLAVVSQSGKIVEDKRVPLVVPNGRKGLRQSEALYQHWENIPRMLESTLCEYGQCLQAVCASEKPRPSQDSYMPVFKAGIAAAKILSASLNIPAFYTTHQEGHFQAGAYGTPVDFDKPLLAAHLSGGTLELIGLKNDSFKIIGGTKDISYGQLLDRTGALLELPFPAGAALDELVGNFPGKSIKNPLSPIFHRDAWLNLSGIETQLRPMIHLYSKEELAGFIFERIAESFFEVVQAAQKQFPADQVLVTGGVASSQYLRRKWKDAGFIPGNIQFCSDNAVGVALMKGHSLCQ
jgi:N6-L-threonylcarbamoyladenine synthase